MERNGVAVETISAVDHVIATGVYPDMTEHGWVRDDWPAISEKVLGADILVLTSPIWLGEKSSVCNKNTRDASVDLRGAGRRRPPHSPTRPSRRRRLRESAEQQRRQRRRPRTLRR
jgi:hypothetical protein